MKVVALAGGTGSAKLLRGLASIVPALTVIANVGDNCWFEGLRVCPDIDIATYALAGVSDEERGWGIRGDTFAALGQLAELGEDAWFRMGDRDLAVSMVRTGFLRAGRTLTEATSRIAKSFRIRGKILPATDDELETWLLTRSGWMHLQEYWVKNRGRLPVKKVAYRGAASAEPSPGVKAAMTNAEKVVFCPANPITSIGPILAVKGMRSLLSRCRARVVALSPMVGRGPFSGPAGRLMKQLGVRPDSAGVAGLYSGLVDMMVMDTSDAALVHAVEDVGVACSLTDTRMSNVSDEKRLASVLLRA